jgi:hypothetical protein
MALTSQSLELWESTTHAIRRICFKFTKFDTYQQNVSNLCIKQVKLLRNALITRHTFDLIHIDNCGPFVVKFLFVARYILTFIDDYNHFGHIHFLLKKNETLSSSFFSPKFKNNLIS